MKRILLIIAILILLINCSVDKDCKYTKVFGCKKELGFFEKPNNQLGLAFLATRQSNTATTTAPTFAIGGTITGLIGTGLVLQNTTTNNVVEELTIVFGSTSFTFLNKVSTYTVAIKTSPSNLTCTLTNGTGTASADITSITISCISKALTLTGNVTTFAGTATSAGTTDGTGATARFNSPFNVLADGSGNLFVSEAGGNCIRRIVISTAAVTTVAGACGVAGNLDGTGTAARFTNVQGMVSDGTNLFVAESGNHKIRKVVIATGVVTTIAGDGSNSYADGSGTAARFSNPAGIVTDGPNLYIAEFGNHTIRKLVIATAVVTTISGSAGVTGTIDGTGTAARFNQPGGMTTDGTNLYIVEVSNHTLRRLVISTGVVTTLAGAGGVSGTTDATGTAARLNGPQGVLLDGTSIFIGDRLNHSIRRYNITTGVVTTYAGVSGTAGTADGTIGVSRYNQPIGLGTDGTSLFIADLTNHTIRRIQ